jgi:hypothetical protein
MAFPVAAWPTVNDFIVGIGGMMVVILLLAVLVEFVRCVRSYFNDVAHISEVYQDFRDLCHRSLNFWHGFAGKTVNFLDHFLHEPYKQDVDDNGMIIVPTFGAGGPRRWLAFLNGMFVSARSKGLVNTVRRAKQDLYRCDDCDDGVFGIINRGKAKFMLCTATVADAMIVRSWAFSEMEELKMRPSHMRRWAPRIVGAILYNSVEERDLNAALVHDRPGAFTRRSVK